MMEPTATSPELKPRIRLLHLGNSIQYYNDCPRVLREMLVDSQQFDHVDQKVCLRGGCDFVSLHRNGTHWIRRAVGGDYGVGTVSELFQKDLQEEVTHTFAIFNDHTQAPARLKSREASLKALEDVYVPKLQAAKAIPIFVETVAYKTDFAYGTKDIGNYDQFTKLLQEGYLAYQTKLNELLPDTPCYIARMGTAHCEIRPVRPELWEKLYSSDQKHPSPHGTLLQAYLLYLVVMTSIGMDPNDFPVPKYNPKWLDPWFRMSVPTEEESNELLQVAKKVFLAA